MEKIIIVKDCNVRRRSGEMVNIYGRAWLYDTGDPPTFELFAVSFQPLGKNEIGDKEWALQHFMDYLEADLRELFRLPVTGSYHVLFCGILSAKKRPFCDPEHEWQEQFHVNDTKFCTIPPVESRR